MTVVSGSGNTRPMSWVDGKGASLYAGGRVTNYDDPETRPTTLDSESFVSISADGSTWTFHHNVAANYTVRIQFIAGELA